MYSPGAVLGLYEAKKSLPGAHVAPWGKGDRYSETRTMSFPGVATVPVRPAAF